MQTAEETVTLTRKEYEKLKSFEHQLAELKRLVFGAKSERFIAESDVNQLPLFEGAERKEKPETDPQNITYQRKQQAKEKQHPIRALLPAHLPRQEEIIEPEELSEGSRKIGEEVTEVLEHTPGKLYVRRIVRPKYVNQGQEGVSIASLPSLPIPKGNAGAGLLAHLLISKYVDHLPFYRQVQMFKREGVKLSESTINGWFKAVCKLMEPLYEEIRKQVLDSDYIKADETPIPVQSSNKPGATHTGYLWVYQSPEKKLVIFDYQKSRSAQGPKDFFTGYQGALQTDGYVGYEQFEGNSNITMLGCMAHARRYFEKALDNDQSRAEYVLTEIQKLYALERKAKENSLTAKQLTELRLKKALPILEVLHGWMKDQYNQVTPKSSIGKALAYSLKFWGRLVRYAENGTWHIDNNPIENSIRPVALGRKNYLFAGSHNGAQWAAMMYTFLGTCKLNVVNPYEWLKDTLNKIPDTPVNRLDNLLPQNWAAIQQQTRRA